jgi:hypothetical protein
MPQRIRGIDPTDPGLDAEPTQPAFQIVPGVRMVPMEKEDVLGMWGGLELPFNNLLGLRQATPLR